MSKVTDNLRLLVAHRASFRCEYCRIPDMGFGLPFQVDHIRALKHGGTSAYSNLAYCCPDCNRYKGTDVGSYGEDDETLIPFYNPRKDAWQDHFILENGKIRGLTQVGVVSTKIFRFNLDERVLYRLALMDSDLY
jgi:5-methylcytosine-specific restriction endonuclease McrA